MKNTIDNPIYVRVAITTESGCDATDGEYSLELTGFTGALDIDSPGGVDDISLIKEAIEDHVDFSSLPKEGITLVTLRESGEWEDVFWHKYYVVEHTLRQEL